MAVKARCTHTLQWIDLKCLNWTSGHDIGNNGLVSVLFVSHKSTYLC